MAPLTVALVVRGPGLKSNLSLLIASIFIFLFIAVTEIGIAVIDWGLRNHCNGFFRSGINLLATQICRFKNNVLDRIRWNLMRILLKNYKIRKFAGSDRALVVLIECGVGSVQCPHFDGFIHADSLILTTRDAVGTLADRKSTRLNSSHANISYAVFCLQKK